MAESKDASVEHSLTNAEISRYSRQLIMPEIGPDGQMALKRSSALIIGAGGLGCPVAIYLAAAGIGRLGIVDHDAIELSNLHRQVLHREQNIGSPKANSVADRCRELNSGVSVEAIAQQFSNNNALDIVQRYDIVLDCTDNVVARYLINDACVLSKRPLVSGAALGLEGQVCIYNYNGGPCYRCLHPLPPPPETVVSCSVGGVLGIVPGIVGSLQALEALKLLLQLPAGSGPTGRELRLFNALDASLRVVTLRRRLPECDICGNSPTITDLSTDYVQFCGVPACDTVPMLQRLKSNARYTAGQFAQVYFNNKPHLLLDVRPKCEFNICRLRNSLNIPLSELVQPAGKEELLLAISPMRHQLLSCIGNDAQLPIFVICRRGNDSQEAVRILQEQLAEQGCSLHDIAGGLTAWAAEVDKDFPIY